MMFTPRSARFFRASSILLFYFSVLREFMVIFLLQSKLAAGQPRLWQCAVLYRVNGVGKFYP